MMQQLVDKARVLMEALPYMRRFMGRTIVVKYGGHAMTDDSYQASFAADVVLLKHIGLRPVIVHGGGPQIESTLARMGKQSTFVDGRRVTDDETMEVVEMVLGGKINREIVELVQQAGGRAIGFTGSDGGLLRVVRKLISQLSVADCKRLIADGTVKGGMIPKMECCMQALAGGVSRTHVVDGRIRHAVLLEIFSDDAGVGTLLVP